MDSLIFLVILFFAGRWFFGRVKRAATTASNSDARRDDGQQISFEKFGSFTGTRGQEEPTKYRETPLEQGMSMYDYVPVKSNMGPRSREYGGSLGFSSLEGVDICDESLNHDRIVSEEGSDLPEEPKEVAGLSLSFTKDAIVQGIVMSEILARPSERKWGKR